MQGAMLVQLLSDWKMQQHQPHQTSTTHVTPRTRRSSTINDRNDFDSDRKVVDDGGAEIRMRLEKDLADRRTELDATRRDLDADRASLEHDRAALLEREKSLLESARIEADAILSRAHSEAESIRTAAHDESENMRARTRVETDQLIADTRAATSAARLEESQRRIELERRSNELDSHRATLQAELAKLEADRVQLTADQQAQAEADIARRSMLAAEIPLLTSSDIAALSPSDLVSRFDQLQTAHQECRLLQRHLLQSIPDPDGIVPERPLGPLSDQAKKKLFEKMELLLTDATMTQVRLKAELEQAHEHAASLTEQLEEAIAAAARAGTDGNQPNAPGESSDADSRTALDAELNRLRDSTAQELAEARQQAAIDLDTLRSSGLDLIEKELLDERAKLSGELAELRAAHQAAIDQLELDRQEAQAQMEYELDMARQAAQLHLEEELDQERDSRMSELHAAADERQAKADEDALLEAKQLNALKADRLVTLSAQISNEIAEMRDARRREVEEEMRIMREDAIRQINHQTQQQQQQQHAPIPHKASPHEEDAAPKSSLPPPVVAASDGDHTAAFAALQSQLSSHRSTSLSNLEREITTLRTDRLSNLNREFDADRQVMMNEFESTKQRMIHELTDLRQTTMARLKQEEIDRRKDMIYEIEQQKQDIKRQWFKEVRTRKAGGGGGDVKGIVVPCTRGAAKLISSRFSFIFFFSLSQWGAAIHAWLAGAKERSLPLDVLLSELALHLSALTAERERRTLKKVAITHKPRPTPNVGIHMPGTHRGGPSMPPSRRNSHSHVDEPNGFSSTSIPPSPR